MAAHQIARYYQNEDTSIIEFHQFTSETYPTYTLCFEDNAEGGIYVGSTLDNKRNLTVYFDGRWLRHETSHQSQSDWKNKWTPNIPFADLAKLFGIPESMYFPINSQSINNPFISQLILFNETYLIPPAFYKSLLKGDSSKKLSARTLSFDISEINITFPDEALDEIEFGNTTIHFIDFLEEYTTETTTDATYGWLDADYEKLQTNCFSPPFLCKGQVALKGKFDAIIKESFPFVLSYQDPDRVCYGPKTKRPISNGNDYLTLDVQAMIEHVGLALRSGLPFLRIYIHMPGQLLRMLGRSVAHLSVADMMTEHCYEKTGIMQKEINGLCSGTKISFFMSQATLLKKRHDAIAPCDKDLKNEDFKIMTAIINEVGCIPSFWNGIHDYPGTIRPCKTATDYQKIYKYASNVALSRKLIMQPCEEMIVVTNIVKESGRRHEEKSLDRDTRKQTTYLDIAFVVGSEMFQEIDNLRAFGLESCWSGIGGFVGMFVGYSILQLPEFLAYGWEWLLKAVMQLV